jgi:tetratricopeptide (TPR) repeat protein
MAALLPEAESWFLDGTHRLAADDTAGAEQCFRQALQLVPDFAEAIANLGLLRERAGAAAEAEACYWRALALRPDALQLYLNLGVLLNKAKRFDEAEAVYQQALRVAPDAPAAWSYLGVLYACMQREDEAEQCHRTALRCDSAYSQARFNLAYVLLRQGRFEEGWQCLEARDWYERLEKHFTCPRWRGEALAGKSLVIGFEAGHGDMIQFCRYAWLLKQMGAARIALICHPGLKALFGTLADVDEVISFDEEVPASGWDFWTPPLSLPYHCRTRMENVPAPIPYLAADPARVAKWLPVLPASGHGIGLVWKGNPRFENDADRSLPSLAALEPLAGAAGAQFVSLQKGAGEEEAHRPPAGMSLLPIGERLADFADTAAVVVNLDLVISVDTAVAHLAGALGKPCWLLLPDYKADWRWLADRRDTPWYPGRMRLFRQPRGGGWATVVATLAEELAAWIGTSHGGH